MIRRVSLASARIDRLFFAQVREDPQLEHEVLKPAPGKTIAVVSSGGCTALSLLAAGAGSVFAVDLNAAQNHLVELKAAALAALPLDEALPFLGAVRARKHERLAAWAAVRTQLSEGARRYWDERRAAIARGVLSAGVTERFMGALAFIIRHLIQGEARVQRLLSARSLEEQRAIVRGEWNNRRWRWLFKLLLNRWVFDRTYTPGFFANASATSFSQHFRRLVEHGLAEIPVGTNYFLHFLLRGEYPRDPSALPPYLTPEGARAVAGGRDRLTLVDSAFGDWLQTLPPASIDGFALSNICEWMSPEQIDALFAQIERTAAPGARVCLRRFVCWTRVPARFAGRIVEDIAAGPAFIARDRSLVQSGFGALQVQGPGER